MAVATNKWDRMHSARRAELLAQGASPEEAMEVSAMETLRARQAEIRAATPRGPDGRIPLSEDEAAFDASMADAMGQGNLAAAATPIEMEPELSAPVYRRAPKPVDYGTGESEAGEDIYSAEEAAAYRHRKPTAAAGLPEAATPEEVEAAMAPGGPYRGGEYLPSQEDADMYARGLVYNVNPVTGAAGYSVAYPQQSDAIGAPGRLGARMDLRQPVRDSRTGQLIEGTHKYEKSVADSPLGQVEVYRPSAEFREQLAAEEHRKRIERLGSAAGMNEADVLAMTSGEQPADLAALRSQGRLRREAAKEGRQALVAQRAMERQNPMSQMDDEWRQYILASQMLGRPAGASPSDVDRAHNEQLTALGLRVAQGQGFQQASPEMQEAMRNRARAERMEVDPAGVGREDIQGGNLSSPASIREFRRLAELMDTGDESPVWWMPGVGGMSDANEQAMAEALIRDYGMDEAQAARVARQYSNERRRGPTWLGGGNWSGRPAIDAE